MNPYSVYEYLAFILPGASVLFVSVYGWYGWPWKEPGGTALVGLLAACFIVGNLLSAVATWLAPVLLGRWPGSVPSGLWGQFAKGDRYAGQQDEVKHLFRQRYGDVSLNTGYDLARTEVRNSKDAADGLDRINQQIGFYRAMTIASFIGLVIEVVLARWWHTHLLPALWIPILAASSVMFAYRYRRFWRWYGDYILRTIRLSQSREKKG